MRTEFRSACLLLGLLAMSPGGAQGQGIDAPRITQTDFKKLIAAKNVGVEEANDEFTSARAALMLKERGVKDVRALVGGWNTWVSDKGPVATGQ